MKQLSLKRLENKSILVIRNSGSFDIEVRLLHENGIPGC